MKRKVSDYVICPFYHFEERQIIYCEGVEYNTAIHLAFASPPQLREYKKKYCEKEYCNCRIAAMLERKWEESEQ